MSGLTTREQRAMCAEILALRTRVAELEAQNRWLLDQLRAERALADLLAEALRQAHDPNCWCMTKDINPRPGDTGSDIFRCDEWHRNNVALAAYDRARTPNPVEDTP